jgi:hypothetical protein
MDREEFDLQPTGSVKLHWLVTFKISCPKICTKCLPFASCFFRVYQMWVKFMSMFYPRHKLCQKQMDKTVSFHNSRIYLMTNPQPAPISLVLIHQGVLISRYSWPLAGIIFFFNSNLTNYYQLTGLTLKLTQWDICIYIYIYVIEWLQGSKGRYWRQRREPIDSKRVTAMTRYDIIKNPVAGLSSTGCQSVAWLKVSASSRLPESRQMATQMGMQCRVLDWTEVLGTEEGIHFLSVQCSVHQMVWWWVEGCCSTPGFWRCPSFSMIQMRGSHSLVWCVQ